MLAYMHFLKIIKIKRRIAMIEKNNKRRRIEERYSLKQKHCKMFFRLREKRKHLLINFVSF